MFFDCIISLVDSTVAVLIELENGAKDHQGCRAGIYQRSSDVNGKPSYIMGRQAIWYHPDSNHWSVGNINDLGSKCSGIFTKNDFGGLTDERNVWYYLNGTWKTAETNDIIIKGVAALAGMYF